MSRWKYFKKEEFACPCCGLNKMDEDMIDILDKARDKVGFPMVITSGTRCAKHNKEKGGAPNSAHLPGPDDKSHAADTAIQNDHQRFLLVKAFIELGIVRVEDAPTWVHADNAKNLPQEVLFRNK